jgi:hypothetical protein
MLRIVCCLRQQKDVFMMRPGRKIAETSLKSSRSLDRSDYLLTKMNSELDVCKHKYISDRFRLCTCIRFVIFMLVSCEYTLY